MEHHGYKIRCAMVFDLAIILASIARAKDGVPDGTRLPHICLALDLLWSSGWPLASALSPRAGRIVVSLTVRM